MAAKQSGGGWKWVIILVIAGGVIVAGVWYFKRGKSDAPQYQSTPVERGELTQFRDPVHPAPQPVRTRKHEPSPAAVAG